MKRRSAFTLIELLVAVAIIAILVALLVASVGAVRSKADSAKCVSNLRSTGMAAIQFFTDNAGDFLPRKYWEIYPSWGPSGKEGMRDYLGVESDLLNITGVPEFYRDSIITCPTLRRRYPKVSNPLHRTYSYNFYLNKKDPSSTHNSIPSSERPDLANSYRKLGNADKPSAMWMFTDGVINSAEDGYGSYITDTINENSLPFPHEGRQNFVFLDGHVEGLDRQQFADRKNDRYFWGKVD